MRTKLHWIDGPWPGRLAMAARPRGGDWLDDEMAGWRSEGVDTVVSFLTAAEDSDLGLSEEGAVVRRHGLSFLSVPVSDRDVPASEDEFREALGQVEAELAAGRSVMLQCRQGVGRSGMAAVCLLFSAGMDPKTAVDRVTAARGVVVPETMEQRRWIDSFSETLTRLQR